MSMQNVNEAFFSINGILLTIFFPDAYHNLLDKNGFNVEVNTTKHVHSHYELFFVSKGSLNYFVDGAFGELQEGEFLIVRPNTDHYTNVSSGTLIYNVSCISFSYQALPNSASSVHVSWTTLLDSKPYVTFSGDRESLMVMELLQNTILHENMELCGNYLYALLTKATYLYSEKFDAISPKDQDASRLYKIELMMTSYFNTDISKSDIANCLHISERQLSRIIQKHYGCGFRDFITKFRMETAKNMLKSGYRIQEVAESVGYTSIKAFQTAFLRYAGMPPGKFQRQIVD